MSLSSTWLSRAALLVSGPNNQPPPWQISPSPHIPATWLTLVGCSVCLLREPLFPYPSFRGSRTKPRCFENSPRHPSWAVDHAGRFWGFLTLASHRHISPSVIGARLELPPPDCTFPPPQKDAWSYSGVTLRAGLQVIRCLLDETWRTWLASKALTGCTRVEQGNKTTTPHPVMIDIIQMTGHNENTEKC